MQRAGARLCSLVAEALGQTWWFSGCQTQEAVLGGSAAERTQGQRGRQSAGQTQAYLTCTEETLSLCLTHTHTLSELPLSLGISFWE